jgi:multidrug efflux pump subunit AcrA (membrane-fusion protein)
MAENRLLTEKREGVNRAMRHQKWILPGLVVALALLAAGCDQIAGQASEEPAETEAAAPEPFTPIVSATGEVVPAQEATLSFPIDGQVVEILAAEGDVVAEGDVLARMDTSILEASLRQAEAALALAEADLAQASASSREQEIEQAEGELAAAQADTAEAARRRDALYTEIGEDEILLAQRDLLGAINNQWYAQNTRDVATGWATNHDPNFLDTVPENYNPEAHENARRDTQTQYEIATQQVVAAQAYLDDLLDGPNPDEVRVIEAQMWAASAEAQAAQSRLALLEAGPLEETVAIFAAQVEEARAQVAIEQAVLDKAILYAPFDGTVSDVQIQEGEYVHGGTQVLLLADLDSLRVETTDLNEIDVARIQVGSPATVTFDALPDEVIGTITRIAPMAAEGSGVNYTVVVELDEMPPAARWGMTAFVDVEVDE